MRSDELMSLALEVDSASMLLDRLSRSVRRKYDDAALSQGLHGLSVKLERIAVQINGGNPLKCNANTAAELPIQIPENG